MISAVFYIKVFLSVMAGRGVRWAFNFNAWNPTQADILLASSCIQPEEKQRLAKFVFKNDFKSSLIGRLMMRKFVHEALGLSYKEVRFFRDAKGKPYLNNSKISFNVSHQGNFAVFAAEIGDVVIGVDVMKLEYSGGKRLSDFFRLMTRHFSPSEWDTIRKAGNDKKQIGMFCRHWALKESYVKALGVGITVNLQDLSFKINTGVLKKDLLVHDTELFIKTEKQNWIFEEMLLDDNHCVAVALKGTPSDSILFKELNIDEIVDNCEPVIEKDQNYVDLFFKKLDKN